MTHKYTFRFDDISLNTDESKLRQMVECLQKRCDPEWLHIILAVSPAVFDMSQETGLERERAFPKMLHTESDFRRFYQIQKTGVPAFIAEFAKKKNFTIAGHGLIHVDHRLLSRKAQEMSILTSCSLIGSRVFVPPFHKWNDKTEAVCREHGIELVKFVPWVWKHLLYHRFNTHESKYYLHTHDFTYEQFIERLS